MIAASALLLLLGLILLVAGFFQDGLGMIYGSIVSTLLAGVALVLGIVKDRGRQPAVAVPGESLESGIPAQSKLLETEASSEASEGAAVPSALIVEPEPATVEAAPATARRPASRAAAKAPTAASPNGPASTQAEKVVVIPDRDKYHKDGCRYAKAEGAMTLTKAQARRRGYKQCGLCKP